MVMPFKHFSAGSKPLQSIVSSDDHLIVGGKNCLQGYNWESIKNPKTAKQAKPDWNIDLNLPTYLFQVPIQKFKVNFFIP